MPTTIKLKNSVTTTSTPTSLVQGEVAINITDKKVWVGNAATTPIQLLGDGGSASFTSIAFGAGTVSLPSITFTGDTNTGIYSPAADTIAFTEGGVESMRITSNGDVGIGTASPVTDSGFKILTIDGSTSGALYIRNNGTNRFRALSDSSAAYLYAMASTGLIFGSNDTERMRITSAGDVGIGTSSPSYKLTVSASDGIIGGILGTTRGIRFVTNSSFASVQGVDNTGSASYQPLFLTGSIVQLGANGVENMRIDSSGNVGIGTNSPRNAGAGYQGITLNGSTSGFLDINTNGSRVATLYGTGSDFVLVNPTSTGVIALSTNNTERMRVASGGNVGIGTANPFTILDVFGNAVAPSTTANNGIFRIQTGTSNEVQIGTYSTSPFSVWIQTKQTNNSGSVFPLAINPLGGGLLIGTASILNNNYSVQTTNSFGGYYAGATGAGDGNFVSVSTAIAYHFYAESTTAKFYVVNNGTIYSTNTAVQAISDARHKENIKDLETGLDEVLALKPRRFDWKEGCGTGNKNVAGFIAQEVEQVLPDLIGEWKNKMNDEESFKSLAMGNMIPTLVKAIQELNAKVAELEAKIK